MVDHIIIQVSPIQYLLNVVFDPVGSVYKQAKQRQGFFFFFQVLRFDNSPTHQKSLQKRIKFQILTTEKSNFIIPNGN